MESERTGGAGPLAIRIVVIGWLVFLSLGCNDHTAAKPPESGLWITGNVQDLGGRPIKGAQAIVWLASTDPNEARPRRRRRDDRPDGGLHAPRGSAPAPDPAEAPTEPPRIRFEREGYVDASAQPRVARCQESRDGRRNRGHGDRGADRWGRGRGPFDPADTTRIIALRVEDPNEVASAGINEKVSFASRASQRGATGSRRAMICRFERECDVSADAGPSMVPRSTSPKGKSRRFGCGSAWRSTRQARSRRLRGCLSLGKCSTGMESQ